jgi:hypothetical protein
MIDEAMLLKSPPFLISDAHSTVSYGGNLKLQLRKAISIPANPEQENRPLSA